MPIGSVEGLLGTLLFVVPGGLGIALRRAIFAAQAPSGFTEALHALASALVALLATESLFAVVDPSRNGIGDYLLVPLSEPASFPEHLSWGAYAAFLAAALLLPAIGAWLRRLPPARNLFRAVSPHADGLDYVVHEARPKGTRREEVWVTVNTVEDEVLLGQLAWRSTAPDPLELVLSRVRDVSDPTEDEQQEEWVVWLPGDAIRAVWVNIPEI